MTTEYVPTVNINGNRYALPGFKWEENDSAMMIRAIICMAGFCKETGAEADEFLKLEWKDEEYLELPRVLCKCIIDGCPMEMWLISGPEFDRLKIEFGKEPLH